MLHSQEKRKVSKIDSDILCGPALPFCLRDGGREKAERERCLLMMMQSMKRKTHVEVRMPQGGAEHTSSHGF